MHPHVKIVETGEGLPPPHQVQDAGEWVVHLDPEGAIGAPIRLEPQPEGLPLLHQPREGVWLPDPAAGVGMQDHQELMIGPRHVSRSPRRR